MPLFGQTSPFQIGWSSTTSSSTELERMFGDIQLSDAARQMIFEGPLDPEEYRVGPGDRFRVYYWQPKYSEYPASVNAEGILVIPLVGSVDVAGMTLAQAREEIRGSVGRAMRSGQVTISLEEPRKFRVHVTGQVNVPGTYVVPATARVSDAIVVARGLKRELRSTHGDTTWAITASQRRIELRDREGETVGSADLRLFLQGGVIAANPYLTDGQTIHVPHAERTRRQIGVFGAVHQAGLFEYVAGDRVSDALALAGGFTSLADRGSVRLVSLNGSSERMLDLSTGDVRALAQSLSPGDRMYVAGRPDTLEIGSVTLQGQISRPGGYPIVPGETTLAEVLEEAGGLLSTAASNSARLVRTGMDRTMVERRRVALADGSRAGDPAFKADPELAAEFARWDYGTVVIDLSGNGRQAPEDVILHDGDVLDVPAEPLGVRVLGFVNNGGEVPWIEGGRLGDYLTLTGGINAGGWRNRTVVIKARNGSQVRYSRNLTIDPGDVIYIPSKPDVTNWERFKDVVSVTAQLVTLALVIDNVSK